MASDEHGDVDPPASGLRGWPLTRRSEAELTTRVTRAAGPELFNEAFAAGSELHLRDALALVRDGTTASS